MATATEISEKLRVRITVPIAGNTFSYSLDQEVVLDRGLALAFCVEPEDGPRAIPVGWNLPDELELQEKHEGGGKRRRGKKASVPETGIPPLPGAKTDDELGYEDDEADDDPDGVS